MSQHDNIVPESLKKPDVPGRRVAPQQALQRLQEGNARYKRGEIRARDYSVGRAEREAKQYPFAAVLSCADSRVAPELAFDQGPGDVFVVRLAGNFVNTDGLASVEYAVEFLKVGLIVVMGHTHCGAVDAAIKVIKEGVELPGALPCLVENIKPIMRRVLEEDEDDQLNRGIRSNVRENVKRLREDMAIVGHYVKTGEVEVVGAVYDLASGHIEFLDD